MGVCILNVACCQKFQVGLYRCKHVAANTTEVLSIVWEPLMKEIWKELLLGMAESMSGNFW